MSGTSNKVITNRKTAGAVYIQNGLKLFDHDSKSVVVVNEVTECSDILWDENDRKVAINKVDKRDKSTLNLFYWSCAYWLRVIIFRGDMFG